MKKQCDLHLHLGGSISKELLIAFAKSDKNQKALEEIETAGVLEMFHVVHALIDSPERIEISTEDVIKTSFADYLEIRSTPRKFSSDLSLVDYVEAFVAGLNKYPEKARGLLSIDRYKHDIKRAQEIIDLALGFPDTIVGIDISGINPPGTRVLQGEDLNSIIEIILDSPLGLALHIAELDCEKDERDSTSTLEAIDTWFDRNPKIKPFGKIRLGHALFLQDAHKRIVRKHQLPVEICPSCHRYIGSWKDGHKHPVEDLYFEKDAPVIIGTDDALIFSTDFKKEMALAGKELPYDLDGFWQYRFKTINP